MFVITGTWCFYRDAKASQFGPNGERTPQNTSRLAKMIASQITPTKATLEHMANVTEVTHPDPSKVTYRERLQLLSEVYSGCLQGLYQRKLRTWK